MAPDVRAKRCCWHRHTGAVSKIAHAQNLMSIAFPAISTGVYGYPMDDAAQIAFTTMRDFLETHDGPQLVRMVVYDARAFQTHARVLQEMFGAP